MVSRFYVQKVSAYKWDYNFDILFVIVIVYKRRWSSLKRPDLWGLITPTTLSLPSPIKGKDRMGVVGVF